MESDAQSVGGSGAHEERSIGDCRGDRRCSKERAPRGRCRPPVPPAPNPRRGEMMKKETPSLVGKPMARNPSRIVLVSEAGHASSRPPMSNWKRGYIGFKRKVKSSTFMPLLLLLAFCGLGVHAIGLGGLTSGYFRWSIGCEGVVTVGDDAGRANGEQIYNIGWVRYEGAGPHTASEAATIATNSSGNGTVGSDLGLGGIAGSSIPEQDWLAGIDATSAALGALTAVGHLAGFVFYALTLSAVLRLFRTQFRSGRPLFRPASKASGALLVWMVGIGGIGFNFAVQEEFKERVLSILGDEGFLCQAESRFEGEFSYIATGFGCASSALMFLLTWHFGQAADFALAERFERKSSMVDMAAIAP